MIDKSKLHAGIIWVASAIALTIYGVLLYLNTNIPGLSELITYLTTIETKYIYLAAFISIFIEGLYFIGSFFPGASFVIILAVISQTGGTDVFATTLLLIFIGWSLAGIVNIFLAKVYRKRIIKLETKDEFVVNDKLLTTWFPAFRSSYEVAQITEGGNPNKVFISSLKVRFWATGFVGLVAFVVPLFFDIKETTNKEGYGVIIIVVLLSLIVGIRKIYDFYQSK